VAWSTTLASCARTRRSRLDPRSGTPARLVGAHSSYQGAAPQAMPKKSAAAKAPENRHLRDPNAPEVEVTAEDQKRINHFGRLNNRMQVCARHVWRCRFSGPLLARACLRALTRVRPQELKDDIKEKTKDVTNVEDAANEIEMLLDDDACLLKVGELFVHVSNEEADEKIKAVKEVRQKELAALREELEVISKQMEELKKLLYSKFGNSINLELDEEDEDE
jgi:prefoldin subunit 4